MKRVLLTLAAMLVVWLLFYVGDPQVALLQAPTALYRLIPCVVVLLAGWVVWLTSKE